MQQWIVVAYGLVIVVYFVVCNFIHEGTYKKCYSLVKMWLEISDAVKS